MKKILCIIMTCTLLVGCSGVLRAQNEKTYLSFSYTTYDDKKGPEGGMSTNIMMYDIEKQALEELDSVKYTSQYPLGVYSNGDNSIYYSGENPDTGGDDLFCLNLNNGSTTQLTEGLFAINFIVPRTEDILLVAVKKGTKTLRLIQVDKKTGEVSYDDLSKDEVDTWAIGLNIDNPNEYYTASFVREQAYENSRKASTGEHDKYYYADHWIDKINGDFQKKEELYYFEKEQVESISATDRYILIYRDPDFSKPEEYELTLIEKGNNEWIDVKPKEFQVGRYCILSPDNKGVFYLGLNPNRLGRGIYYYDFETQNVDVIFEEEPGVGTINNMILLRN